MRTLARHLRSGILIFCILGSGCGSNDALVSIGGQTYPVTLVTSPTAPALIHLRVDLSSLDRAPYQQLRLRFFDGKGDLLKELALPLQSTLDIDGLPSQSSQVEVSMLVDGVAVSRQSFALQADTAGQANLVVSSIQPNLDAKSRTAAVGWFQVVKEKTARTLPPVP